MKKIIAIITGLTVPSTALAISITNYGWSCTGFLFCGDATNAIAILVSRVIAAVSLTISAVATIVVIYGGIRMIISGTSEGKEAGKKAVKFALLGLALGLMAWRIITYMQELLYSI